MLEGYFKEAVEVLKLNIESLLLTVHNKTRITIYNNNSTPAVKAYIEDLYDQHEVVDQVFHSKENLGQDQCDTSRGKREILNL